MTRLSCSTTGSVVAFVQWGLVCDVIAPEVSCFADVTQLSNLLLALCCCVSS